MEEEYYFAEASGGRGVYCLDLLGHYADEVDENDYLSFEERRLEIKKRIARVIKREIDCPLADTCPKYPGKEQISKEIEQISKEIEQPAQPALF